MVFNNILSGAFGLVFGPLLGLPSVLSVAVIAGLMTVFYTVLNKVLVNQGKVRELKAKIAELTKKGKSQNEAESKAAMTEALSLQNQQMMMSFKPLLVTLVLFSVLLTGMPAAFNGPVAILPASLPFFGADFGWFMWYFVVSIPASIMARKLLGVE
jgi:uncharacterized membrane protein (DUF106 family)